LLFGFIAENDATSVPVGKTSVETTLDEVRITLSANNEYFALFKVSGKFHPNSNLYRCISFMNSWPE
jgi:DNA/RNA-binding domain of Phe-tRNA-synthetase-like protein